MSREGALTSLADTDVDVRHCQASGTWGRGCSHHCWGELGTTVVIGSLEALVKLQVHVPQSQGCPQRVRTGGGVSQLPCLVAEKEKQTECPSGGGWLSHP